MPRGKPSIAGLPPLAVCDSNSPPAELLKALGDFALCGARQWASPLDPTSAAALDQLFNFALRAKLF